MDPRAVSSRSFALVVTSCVLALTSAACRRPAEDDPRATLTFVDEGAAPVTITLRSLVEQIPPEEICGWDPYYKKEKRFRALPLRRVLAIGLPKRTAIEQAELILRASDGYAAYFRGRLATEDGAYVAFEDLDVAGWEPIGPQRANPSPFYVVWSRPEQTDLERYPRPWQLAKIEVVRFGVAYPHTKPGDPPQADPVTMTGYGLYRDRCFRCHAINREGGRVGPDLNVPKNILEYRPEDQVRAYVRDPAAFRYGNMPPHPDLTDAQLDALVAYLRAMKDRKFDPKE